MPKHVLFSYRTTNGGGGSGGNRFVGLVQSHLECGGRYHINAEQYHEEEVGRADDDTDCHPEWFNYWTDKAEKADAVIIFNSETTRHNTGVVTPAYSRSKACKKEFNYVKNHSIPYITVGGMMDNGETSEDVAKYIREQIFD